MRIRWKATIPLIGVVGAWLASPQALALVSDKHTHILLALSSLALALTPALVTDRPKTDRVAKRVDTRLRKAGLAPEQSPPPAPPADDLGPIGDA